MWTGPSTACARRATTAADGKLIWLRTRTTRVAPPANLDANGIPASRGSRARFQSVDVLETPRLRLERWEERRRPSFRAIASDREVMRYIGSGETWDRRQADEVFDRGLNHWHQYGFGWCSAVSKMSGDWLGFIGLSHRTPGAIEMRPAEVEIGWWIVHSAWGQGLASEAAAAVRDEGFGRVGLDRIVARVQPANVASAKVAEKIGMHVEREAVGRHDELVLVYMARREVWLQSPKRILARGHGLCARRANRC